MAKKKLQNANVMIVRQELGFSDSCFPLTLELANQVKPLISPLLPRRYAWHFEDRVVLWLSDELEPDLNEYYRRSGPPFIEKYPIQRAEKLDMQLLRELCVRLEMLKPGILSQSVPQGV